MIDYAKAREIALAYIAKQRHGDRLVLLDRSQQEHDFGWVFFYQTREYADTGNPALGVAGNAPIIVERTTGKMVETGTALPIARYIELYREDRARGRQ